jgi:hypothetical protein
VKRFFLVFFVVQMTYSQSKETTLKQQSIWFMYSLRWQINKKYGLAAEAFDRQFTKPKIAHHQYGFRGMFYKKVSDSWQAGTGGAFFWNGPNNPLGSNKLVVPEFRPQLELNSNHKLKWGTLTSRFIFESRFFHTVSHGELATGYQFNSFRLREMLTFSIPLLKDKVTKKPQISLRLQDEIMFNITNDKVKNTFDQNRVGAYLNFSMTPHLSFEGGYMKFFQKQFRGNDLFFYDRDVIRFTLTHRLD